MAFDIQAAKAAGYTDDEINAYMQAKPKTETIAPVAPGQEVDPGEPPPPPGAETYEQAGSGNYMPGLATAGIGAAAAAVPLGIGIGVGKYGGRMLDTMKNVMGSGTSIPVTTTPAPNPAAINLPAGPQMAPVQTAPATPAPQVPQMQAAKSIVQKLALDKILKGAGVLGAGMAIGQGLFGTSDEEIATLKAAEARRKALGQR